LPSPLVVATYWTVRLTPRAFGRLVSERFWAACRRARTNAL